MIREEQQSARRVMAMQLAECGHSPKRKVREGNSLIAVHGDLLLPVDLSHGGSRIHSM
jgi:hypothetical protein